MNVNVLFSCLFHVIRLTYPFTCSTSWERSLCLPGPLYTGHAFLLLDSPKIDNGRNDRTPYKLPRRDSTPVPLFSPIPQSLNPSPSPSQNALKTNMHIRTLLSSLLVPLSVNHAAQAHDLIPRTFGHAHDNAHLSTCTVRSHDPLSVPNTI